MYQKAVIFLRSSEKSYLLQVPLSLHWWPEAPPKSLQVGAFICSSRVSPSGLTITRLIFPFNACKNLIVLSVWYETYKGCQDRTSCTYCAHRGIFICKELNCDIVSVRIYRSSGQIQPGNQWRQCVTIWCILFYIVSSSRTTLPIK